MSLPDPTTDPTGFVTSAMPMCETLGVTAGAIGPDAVELSMPWRTELTTLGGAMHGGALMALADSAAATCAFFNLPEGARGTTTISATTNFLRGVTEGTVTARATPLHAGRTTIVVETEVRAGDRLAVKVVQTQAVLT